MTQLTAPDNYTDKYTQADIAQIKQIIQWANNNGKSQSWLARLSTVKVGTLSSVLNGKYPSSPSDFIRKVLQAIESHERSAEVSAVPFVPSQFYGLACSVCTHARDYKTFGILTAYVGVGKTRSLKEYADNNSNTVLIESPPCMQPTWMLNAILAALGAPLIKQGSGMGNNGDRFHSVVQAVKGSNTLIVVDEADKMMPRCLEYLRRIRDMAGIGIVLAGTEMLEAMIRPQHGQFDQVRSRVGMWPKTIQRASRPDMEEVMQHALGDATGFDETIAELLWLYSDGSMRMLVENLIPTLLDFLVSKNKPLSPDKVKQTFELVLNLNKVA